MEGRKRGGRGEEGRKEKIGENNSANKKLLSKTRSHSRQKSTPRLVGVKITFYLTWRPFYGISGGTRKYTKKHQQQK